MAEKTVLIIDDDQTLVAALKEGLETLGYKVTTAYDGLQGILQAHQSRPRIIMLDFNMPAGGGAGVYERLRGSSDTVKIPIVFLTGATVGEVKEKIRSTPNTFFLKKPVSVSQLRKVLDKILGESGDGKSPASAKDASAPKEAVGGPMTDAPFAGLVLPGASSPPSPVPGVQAAPLEAPPPPAPSPGKPPPGGMPLPQPPPPVQPEPAAAAPVQAPAPAVQPGQGKYNEFQMRVSYADTDRLGIIYYGNYFKFFELGRTEFLRMIGLPYRDIETERRIYMPAVEARCEYVSPCRYDDVLFVRTWLSWMGPASVCFQNEIYENNADGRLVARGFTRHAVLNEQWKPSRLPKDIRERFEQYLQE